MQNRIIKFRAWDNVNYMSAPFTLHDLQPFVKNGLRCTKIQFTSECPVMQYTGLIDKNGKEIYEGDIIKQVYDVENNKYTIVEINWRRAMFNCRKIRSSESIDLSADVKNLLIFWLKENECEIIGNIYENKELICNED